MLRANSFPNAVSSTVSHTSRTLVQNRLAVGLLGSHGQPGVTGVGVIGDIEQHLEYFSVSVGTQSIVFLAFCDCFSIRALNALSLSHCCCLCWRVILSTCWFATCRFKSVIKFEILFSSERLKYMPECYLTSNLCDVLRWRPFLIHHQYFNIYFSRLKVQHNY